MKVALISFTREGAFLCRKVAEGLMAAGHECSAYGKELFAEEAAILPQRDSLDKWTADAFAHCDALIFVGASGIAVRAIAPYVKDKTEDPAVAVVDEKGKYAVSLLSGHLGGANDLVRSIAEITGAEPVITTATDVNGRFAVDEWAKRNHLQIGDRQLAKEISAAILNGEVVGVSCSDPIEGQLPELLCYATEDRHQREGKSTVCEDTPSIGFRISIFEGDGPFEKTLHLIPRTVTVGIGCRKGVSAEAVEELLDEVLKEQKLSAKAIERICSIDLKSEEPALKQLADKLGVPLQFFSAEELENLPGGFTASSFVNQITGVDNVCERAAVLGSGGDLIVKKQARNGVTAAVAVRTGGYKWMQQ